MDEFTFAKRYPIGQTMRFKVKETHKFDDKVWEAGQELIATVKESNGQKYLHFEPGQPNFQKVYLE